MYLRVTLNSMNIYKRLTLKEREEISRLLVAKCSPAQIAEKLGRHRSTISREISLGGCNKYTYRAVKADKRAKRKASKRKSRKRKGLLNRELKKYILSKLKLYWSPEQIAESLKKDYPDNTDMNIAAETIYTTLYVLPKGALKKELLSCLRRRHKKRRRRKKGEQPLIERKIENMVLIDERPQEVEERIIPGHLGGRPLNWKKSTIRFGITH